MNENYIEISNSVDDAVLERIEKLEGQLAYHNEESQRIGAEINELLEFHNAFMRCDAG